MSPHLAAVQTKNKARVDAKLTLRTLTPTTFRMHPPSFPTEIWLEIAIYLRHKDYLALVHVCRNFYNIFIEALYFNLTINLPDCVRFVSINPETYCKTPSAKFALGGPAAAALFDRLEAHPTLRNGIRTVHIKNLSLHRPHNLIRVHGLRWEKDAMEARYTAFGTAVTEFLRDLPNLQRVDFTNLEMHNTWLLHLSSHPTRNLDIHLTDAVLYGDTEPARVGNYPDPHSLSLHGRIEWIDGPSVLSRFLCASSIRTLDLGSLTAWFLHDTFILACKQQLPHLRPLAIQQLGDQDLEILGATSNLRELTIRGGDWIGENVRSAFKQPSFLNRLESISVNACWISVLTTRRSITKISTSDSRAGIDLRTFEPHFGSEVMVRTVEWRSCKRVGELLEYLIARNPGLWHLNLEPVWENTNSEELLKSYISKLAQLPELRTFKAALVTQVPTQRTLDWEREQCRYLKKEGCPNLVSVSFSELITWTRQTEDETYWKPAGPGMATCTRYISHNMPSIVDETNPVDEGVKPLITKSIPGVRRL